MSIYNISSGMTNTGTVLGSGDSMSVSSGGFASDVEVRSAGSLVVLDGGIVSGLTTDYYGHVFISSGGRVESAYLSGGFGYRMVTVEEGGVLSSAQVVNGVDLYVSGAVYDIVLKERRSYSDNSDLILEMNGYAENISVYEGGNFVINGSASANNIDIFQWGALNLNNGAVSNVNVNSGGSMSCHDSFSLTNVNVESKGVLYLSGGEILQNVVLHQGCRLNAFTVLEDQTLNGEQVFSSLLVSSNCCGELINGQRGKNIIVESDGYLRLYNRGSAEDLIVSSGGGVWYTPTSEKEEGDSKNVFFQSGARFNDITIQADTTYSTLNNIVISGGIVEQETNFSNWRGAYLYFGQTASDTLVCSRTKLVLGSDGTADGTTVFGELNVQRDAIAENTVVESGGSAVIGWWGGTLRQIEIRNGGRLGVDLGGSASAITIEAGGYADIHSSATATDIHVNAGGTLNGFTFLNSAAYENLSSCTIQSSIVSGGSNATTWSRMTLGDTLLDGGRLTVQNGAVVHQARVINGGAITITSTGTVDSLTIGSGGILSNSILQQGMQEVIMEDGARLQGTISLNTNLAVNGAVAAENADLVITLGAFQPGNVLISDISGFAPNSWTIVSELEPELGTYVLGGNAADFAGTIVIRDQNGVTYGSLSLSDDLLNYDTVAYHLSLNERSELCLTVSSNIEGSADGVFLYKNGALMASYGEISDVTVGQSCEYDHAYVVNAGENRNWTIDSGGLLFVRSSGTVQDTQVRRGGVMTLKDDGRASGLKVESSGAVGISSGGLASGIEVISNGSLTVREGGSAEAAVAKNSGMIHISNGGIVGGIEVLSSGRLNVSAGGIVSGLRTSANGYVTISSGGMAVDAIISGRMANSRAFLVEEGGVISSAMLCSEGVMTVYGSAHDIAVSGGNTWGYLYLNGNATADHIELLYYGHLTLNDSATASNVSAVFVAQISARSSTVMSNVRLDTYGSLYANGQVYDVEVSNRASMQLGGSLAFASGVTFESGAQGTFTDGITCQDVTVLSGATVSFSDMSSASETALESGAMLNGIRINETRLHSSGIVMPLNYLREQSPTIGKGMICSDFIVPAYREIIVNDGGEVNGLHVLSGGTFEINEGGTASGIVISANGGFRYSPVANVRDIELKDGAVINGIKLLSAISADTLDGFVISNGIVEAYASVYSGQVASDIKVVSSGALLSIQSGGYADNVIISSGAVLYFEANGRAENVKVSSGGKINFITLQKDETIADMGDYVISGGVIAPRVTWNYTYGKLFSGQTAVDTLALSGVYFTVYSGGVASNTNVFGNMDVSEGGRAVGVILNSGAHAYVSGGTMQDVILNEGATFEMGWTGEASIVFNPWQGNINTRGSAATITYLDRDTNVYYGGNAVGLVSRFDTADSMNITSGYSAIVYEGGSVNSAYVNEGGVIEVQSGGSAVLLFTPWSGTVVAEEGADITYLERDAKIYYGGAASGVILKADALDGLTAEAGNTVVIYAGGSASNMNVNSGARVKIQDGGRLNGVYVNRSGMMVVSSGAFATVEYNPWNGTIIEENGADITYLERDAKVYYGGNESGFISKGDSLDHLNVTSGNRAIVYDGGELHDAVVNSSASIEVQSGGFAEIAFNPWGGDVIASNGATITNLDRSNNVYYGGIKSGLLSRGDEFDGLTVTSGNSAIVYSKGRLSNLQTESGGSVLVSNGGIVDNAYFSGGNNKCIVEAGGVLSSIQTTDGVVLNVSGSAYDVVLKNDGTLNTNLSELNLYGNGYAENITVSGSGRILLYDSASANNVEIYSGGILAVQFGGGVSNAIVHSNGDINVAYASSVRDLEIESGGRLYLGSGRVYHVTLNKGCFVNGFTVLEDQTIDEDQIFSSLLVNYGGSASLSSFQFAKDVTVAEGAAAYIEPYAGVENMVVHSDASITVYGNYNAETRNIFLYAGANINNIRLRDDLSLPTLNEIVISGGRINSGYSFQRNYAYLYSGQTAIDILAEQWALFTVRSGAVASDTQMYGELQVSSGGIAVSTVVSSGGALIASKGGNISGAAILSGARFQVQSDAGFIADVVISSGGIMENSYISSGLDFKLLNGAVLQGGIRIAANMTLEDAIDVSSATITMLFNKRAAGDGPMFTNMTCLLNASRLSLSIDSTQSYGVYTIGTNAAGFTGTITVRDESSTTYGTLSLEQPSFTWETTEYTLFLNESNDLCLSIDSCISDLTGILLYKDGRLVSSFQSSYELTVPSNGYEHMFVLPGGIAEETTLNSRGVMTVLSGGTAVGTYNNGLVNVKSGTEVSRIYGGAVHVLEDATVRDVENAKVTVESGGRLVGHSGGGDIIVSSGALVESATKNGGAIYVYGTVLGVNGNNGIKVYQGGYVSGADLRSYSAYLEISSGGTAENVSVVSHANITVFDGGRVSSATVNFLGKLFLSSGGTALDVAVNGGTTFISEGGVLLDVNMTGGAQLISRGGVASRTSMTSGASQIVQGISDETTLNGGGRIVVNRGGVARNIHAVHNGAITVNSFGLASAVEVDAYNLLKVNDLGYASDVSVKSKGELHLLDGAVLGGILRLENGAIVSAYSGATIDFDLSRANDSTPLIDHLNMISGAPDFTLTVSGEIEAGVYLLAGGAEAFDGTISVQDDTLRYGRLSLSNPLVYGWNTYELNLTDGMLSLSVTRNAMEAPSDGERITRETIYDIRVPSRGKLFVSSGFVYYEPYVNNGGSMRVLSGGVAEKAHVLSGGEIIVSSGGTAAETNNEGNMYVLSGGVADHVRVNGYGARMTVSSGGTAIGIQNERIVYVESGAVIEELKGGTVYVRKNTTVHGIENANVYLESGGRLIGQSGGGDIIVSAGALVESATDNQGTLSVYGTALGIEKTGKRVLVYEGGYVSGINMRRAEMDVSSGGIVENASAESGAKITVSKGGLARITAVNSLGSMSVSSGGTASDTVLDNGMLYILSSGFAEKTTMSNGGNLVVSHGGQALDVHAVRRGAVVIESMGQVSSAELDAGNVMLVSSLGRADDLNVKSGGQLYLAEGAVLGGKLHFENGAIISAFGNVSIELALSGANASTPLIDNLSAIQGPASCTLFVSGEIEAGVYLLASGAEAFDGTISVQDTSMRYGSLSLSSPLVYGWNTYELNLTDGMLSLSVTRNATEAPSDGERMISRTIFDVEVKANRTSSIESGFTFWEAQVFAGGKLNVLSGGIAEKTSVFTDGQMHVLSGGIAEKTSVSHFGAMTVSSGGTALETNNSGSIYVKAGAEVSRVNGGTVYIMEDAFARDVENAKVILSSGGRLVGHSGGGDVIVSSGALLESAVRKDGIIYVYGTVLGNSGSNGIRIYQGGYVSGVDLIRANIDVSSGGVIENVSAGSRAFLHVSEGGLARSAIINSAGRLYVSSGGTALDAVINGGTVNVSEGGLLLDADMIHGSQIVFYGGVASRMVLTSNARLAVSRGGLVQDVHAVHNAAIVISCYGQASEVSLDAYNVMMVSSMGRVTDVNVKSGGEVYLMGSATAGGHLLLENGAVFSAYEGSVIDLDLTLANDATPLIGNLSAITGAPTYTITVNAETEYGTYLLANGASDFDGVITVRDEAMKYGSISVDNPLICGWNTYALNLNDDVLTLTISENAIYHEPEPEEPEQEEVVVSSGTEVTSGETLVWEKTGETLRVASGGILKDTEIPWGGTLILEENAVVQGSVRLGTDIQVNGPVKAENARIEFDLSKRKEEYGVQLDNMAYLAALSYSVLVSPDQNKGEYILAGNIGNFNAPITIRNTDGVLCGSLTLEQGFLDCNITRYTLCLNEKNELVFIVSSNITDEADYVLLYKNDKLVLARESACGLTVSGDGEYDHAIILDTGVAEQVVIGAGGLVTVQTGGRLLVTDQNEKSSLRFDYAEGDSTVIKGINSYGAFFVENNLLENVHGEVVTVTGSVLIRNYHGSRTLTTDDGVELTGIGDGGSYNLQDTWVYDFILLSGGATLSEGTIARNTEWNGYVNINKSVLVDRAVFNAGVSLNGGTISNAVFNGDVSISDYVLVDGDLTFNAKIKYLSDASYLDMTGHTAFMDYSTHSESSDPLISLNYISEDVVFQLNFKQDQVIGTYAIAKGLRGLADTYYITVDGNIIGMFNSENRSFVSGIYSYTMTGTGDLFMVIDISEDADETYNILWYDKDGGFHHSANRTGLVIGTDDCMHTIVRNNGVLNAASLLAGGQLSLRAGSRVLGLNQYEDGFLCFNYFANDSTLITGINPYGSFSVGNNVIDNLYGGNVWIDGNVVINDYHGMGLLQTSGGVHVTGTLIGGKYELTDTRVTDFTINANQVNVQMFSILEHGTVNTFTYMTNGSSAYDTVFNNSVYFCGLGRMPFGGGWLPITISNVTINGGYYLRVGETPVEINLAGDLTLNCAGRFDSNTVINANGHTVNVNFKNRTVTDGGMISVSNFSEDVNFRLLFQKDQKIGTYTIAWNAGSFVDFFLLNIGGEDTEELSFENPEMDYGNYHYVMAHNVDKQLITLSIDISENADETFNVYYWDSAEDEFYHSATVDGLDFSEDGCHDLVVRNGGIVTNSTLRSGLITVRSGGQVIGLEHEGGRLRFDYVQDSDTCIYGTNQYGAFFVKDNLMENVIGENVTVTGDVLIRNYHNAGGTLRTDGSTITGTIDGNGWFNLSNSNVHDFVTTGGWGATINTGTSVRDSVFNTNCTVTNGAGRIENVTFNNNATLNGGTYSEVVVNGNWSVNDYITLDGDLTFRGVGRMDQNWWTHAAINGNGFSVTLDLTNRSAVDSAILNINRIYNTELRVIFDPGKAIGTFVLGSTASLIGQGDAKGVYNIDTNKWDFQGATIGDMDGVISICDSNGIELAACTVNGDTEYYGRYNYTVFVDDKGNLKLKVGWNNREGQTYSADEMESNDTLETATEISGSGAGVISNLTIHSDSDVDWFRFELDSFGRKSSFIGIDFKQWAGDLDINLYNSQGELIDYARSVTDNERLSLSGHTAGTYYMKVSGYNGNINSYKLVYSLPESIALPDDYESGDDKAHSCHLQRLEEKITINAAISRTDDQDYYMFIMPERGLISDVITLNYDDEFGDLDLYLYDQDGETLLVTSTNTVGGQERITMAGLQHGVYYAAVKSKDGSVGRYELVFDVNNREVNPDKYENNNSMKKATKLYTLNGEKTLEDLSIHSDADVDYYRFSILEKGSADDFITLTSTPQLGDLDIEILNADGEVVAYSRTAEIEDTVSLNGLDIGEYYIRVYGYNNVANNYTLSWHVTNSSLIPSDAYEGYEPILIREDQTISGLSIAKAVKEDETREDTFKIVLEYDAWKRSKIILTDYRSDWKDGLAYVIRDADGNVLMEGTDSEISLYGLTAGEYSLTLDAPNEDEYSEYNLIAQCLPDSDIAKDNTWSIFIYMAADNNLEEHFMQELLYMQKAVLPDNVEVYVLVDRSPTGFVGERNWTDTRVGKIRHSSGDAVAVQWMYFDGVDTDTYMNTHNLELQQEWDTGNVATLEAFLDWGMKTGRAENYALIIKDHGTSLGYNCSDDTSRSIMSIQDIAELLKADKYKDLSVVAFDECLMGSDVVITTMEGTVDYVVASEAVGYTPNWLVMYKVLLNSFETEMTPRELSQKIVAACNCSGLMDLTLASFHSDDNTLSSALNQFGELSKQFMFADWVALCKCFSIAHNYGDKICGYSDLGSILNLIKGYHETISSTLLDATNALYDVVFNTVIDSTMITPDIYGTGLAVFNPLCSDPMMAYYSYGGGSRLDYYATEIGKSGWGEFMYTLSKVVDDCSSYIVDTSGNLTFTDFVYFYEDGEIKVSYDLGAFSGDGVTFEGLYMDNAAYFNITLMQAGIEGDAIVVTADNPNAEIEVKLVQKLLTSPPIIQTRRLSENGVLSLAGIDYGKARADNTYTLIITSSEETTFTIRYEADWSNGVDYFDFSRTGSISPLAAGNNSIDKATQLPNGNYGGLVTCAGDKDYYKILSVYANTVDVIVKGTGLVVQEYNAEGELLQTAVEDNGLYSLTVATNNYVCVEGSADISLNEYDSYMLSINDAAQTYLKAELAAMLPEKPVASCRLVDGLISISVSAGDGLQVFYSEDMFNWSRYDAELVAADNGRYFFKAVDAEAGLESQYTSIYVELPDIVVPQTQTWKKAGAAAQYIVEYSTDNFEHVIRLEVGSNSLDSFLMTGDCQMRVRLADTDEWTIAGPASEPAAEAGPKRLKSYADGIADVFFANPMGTWEIGYLAQHVGSINDWNGSNEYASISGRNKLADIIQGSTDANILLMTDDDNGDALFVDDIYTALPGSVSEQQARIARIDEIRAGAGNDIVDMTSQRFEYVGDGLTIRGGEGNDTIWANKGDNLLFGDAGSDRIVGASGNDVIAGGIGNDCMHGGGGDDVFTFCENWGVDTVEQLAGGSVTLWFASGDESNWDEATLTYTDGENRVTVSGVTADRVSLKFGDDGAAQFASLTSMGAFLDATTERIFEESGKGILASL